MVKIIITKDMILAISRPEKRSRTIAMATVRGRSGRKALKKAGNEEDFQAWCEEAGERRKGVEAGADEDHAFAAESVREGAGEQGADPHAEDEAGDDKLGRVRGIGRQVAAISGKAGSIASIEIAMVANSMAISATNSVWETLAWVTRPGPSVRR